MFFDYSTYRYLMLFLFSHILRFTFATLSSGSYKWTIKTLGLIFSRVVALWTPACMSKAEKASFVYVYLPRYLCIIMLDIDVILHYAFEKQHVDFSVLILDK